MSPAKYRRIWENLRKNLRNFRIFSWNNVSVNISKNFKIYFTNYYMGVTDDVIFKIEFPKSTLLNWFLIAFVGELASTHFCSHIIRTYCKTLYKIRKLCEIWRHFKRPGVLIVWTKFLFFIYIAENARYRRIFLTILAPPLCVNDIMSYKRFFVTTAKGWWFSEILFFIKTFVMCDFRCLRRS